MNPAHLTPMQNVKAIIAGIIVGVLTAAIMVPATLAGISPLPESPSFALAKLFLGPDIPLIVGGLAHIAWVTLASYIFILLFRRRLTFVSTLLWGLVLWLFALIVFFPILGWGALGLAVSPKLIVGALVPHLLFAVFLWGAARLLIGAPQRTDARRQEHTSRSVE